MTNPGFWTTPALRFVLLLQKTQGDHAIALQSLKRFLLKTLHTRQAVGTDQHLKLEPCRHKLPLAVAGALTHM